jgi:outer membrane protein assembly factor BamB
MKSIHWFTVCAIVLPTATLLSAEDWPQWRGPNGTGVASGNPPTHFSDTQNVKWRVKTPGRGYSTPIVWKDRIYLTTAIQLEEETPPPPGTDVGGSGLGGSHIAKHQFVVMALDLETGKTVWQKIATVATPHQGFRRIYGSFASNSPFTDGETLYAYFGSRGLYAYDFDGKLKWKYDLPMPMDKRRSFGEGSTPAIHGNTIVITCDHEGPSFLVALDKRTGKELWRRDRDEVSTWSTPLITEFNGRTEVIVPATTTVSYDLETGETIWQADGLGTNALPVPVRHEDTVIVMTGQSKPNALSIKLGGNGDLTGNPDYIRWTNNRGNSYTPSPVIHDGIFYFLNDKGMISAFDAITGEKHYHQQRLPDIGSFKASMVAAGGKLYMASEGGMVTVLKLGKEYEVLARNSMGDDEVFMSSPVIVGDSLLLRTEDELFCIAEEK